MGREGAEEEDDAEDEEEEEDVMGVPSVRVELPGGAGRGAGKGLFDRFRMGGGRGRGGSPDRKK